VSPNLITFEREQEPELEAGTLFWKATQIQFSAEGNAEKRARELQELRSRYQQITGREMPLGTPGKRNPNKAPKTHLSNPARPEVTLCGKPLKGRRTVGDKNPRSEKTASCPRCIELHPAR
jgi:hypothetical protein